MCPPISNYLYAALDTVLLHRRFALRRRGMTVARHGRITRLRKQTICVLAIIWHAVLGEMGRTRRLQEMQPVADHHLKLYKEGRSSEEAACPITLFCGDARHLSLHPPDLRRAERPGRCSAYFILTAEDAK